MGIQQQLRKVRQHIAEEGLFQTGGVVIDHGVKQFLSQIEGTPGYYTLQMSRLSRRYNETAITPVWISPAAITGLTGEYEHRDDGHLDYVPHFKPREAGWDSLPYETEVPYGTVLGGNWDQEPPNFSKLLLYRGTRQHYVDGLDWQETVYYSGLVERFREQGWDTEEAETLARERCEKIERVYERINRDGYQSQRELNGHPLHEVTVTIGRDGEVLYNCEGRHRLSVAKVLDLEAIPVLVLVRHADFDGSIETKKAKKRPL